MFLPSQERHSDFIAHTVQHSIDFLQGLFVFIVGSELESVEVG